MGMKDQDQQLKEWLQLAEPDFSALDLESKIMTKVQVEASKSRGIDRNLLIALLFLGISILLMFLLFLFSGHQYLQEWLNQKTEFDLLGNELIWGLTILFMFVLFLPMDKVLRVLFQRKSIGLSVR